MIGSSPPLSGRVRRAAVGVSWEVNLEGALPRVLVEVLHKELGEVTQRMNETWCIVDRAQSGPVMGGRL